MAKQSSSSGDAFQEVMNQLANIADLVAGNISVDSDEIADNISEAAVEGIKKAEKKIADKKIKIKTDVDIDAEGRTLESLKQNLSYSNKQLRDSKHKLAEVNSQIRKLDKDMSEGVTYSEKASRQIMQNIKDAFDKEFVKFQMGDYESGSRGESAAAKRMLKMNAAYKKIGGREISVGEDERLMWKMILGGDYGKHHISDKNISDTISKYSKGVKSETKSLAAEKNNLLRQKEDIESSITEIDKQILQLNEDIENFKPTEKREIEVDSSSLESLVDIYGKLSSPDMDVKALKPIEDAISDIVTAGKSMNFDQLDNFNKILTSLEFRKIDTATAVSEFKALSDAIESSTQNTSALEREEVQAKETADSLAKVSEERAETSSVGSAQQSANAVDQETTAMVSLREEAEKAASSKREFVEANKEVLQSITTSLSGLIQEGNSFDEIAKLLNNFDPSNVTVVAEGIRKLREELNGPVNDNGILKALQDLAKTGVDMKAMAKALESAKKKNVKNLAGAAGQDKASQKSYNEELKVRKQIAALEHQIRMEQAKNPGVLQKDTIAYQKNTPLIKAYRAQIAEIKKVREVQGLNNEELQTQINSEIKAIQEKNKALIEGEKLAARESKKQSRKDVRDTQIKDSYNQELNVKKKILALEQEIKVAQKDNNKDAEAVAAKNNPKIQALEEEKNEIDRIRKARNLYSEELRSQVDSELAAIERENNAILEGREALSRIEIKSGLNNYIGNQYTKTFIEEVEKVETQLRALQDSSDTIDFDKLKTEFKNLGGSVRDLFDKSKLQDSKKALEQNLSSLEAKIEKYINKNSSMGLKFRREIDEIRSALDKADSKTDLNNIITQFNRLDAAVNKAKKTGISFFDMFAKRVKSMSASALARYFSFYDIIRYTRQAVQTIQQLDTALVDLRKTTTMTGKELNQFYYDANDVAKQLGVTTEEIINQAAAWSRLNKIGLLYGNV